MIYVYIVISAVLIPLLDNFFDILHRSYSVWLVPLLFVAFFIGLILLQFSLLALMIRFTDRDKSPDRGARLFRLLLKNSLPIIVTLARVKINAVGTEKLPENTHMLFVCNHQHDFDPVIMLSVFPDAEIGFIGKKEIYEDMVFVSKAMHRMYSLPIDRENDREAAKTIIKAVKILKEDKASIAVFPEGYTSKSCELLPFRNGCFKTAIKAGVPIAVCVIDNTRSIQQNMFRRKTEVEFRLLDVIYPEQYAGMTTAELGDKIHTQMQKSLSEIRG